jgi:nucleotide-binding universal stress UspA family protein
MCGMLQSMTLPEMISQQSHGERAMYKRILVPIDGSETSAGALDAALKLAREHDAELKPLYVVDAAPLMYSGAAFDPSILRDAFVKDGELVIADATERMQREGVKGSTLVLEVNPVGDDIAQQITRAAREFDADLVVMGTHGRRGWRRLVLGSVAERFLRMSTRPVLLIPRHEGEEDAPHGSSAPDVPGAWL